MATAAVTGRLAEKALALHKNTHETEKLKILNYNPHMGYRCLGKTNIMISEVGLGGHWKDRQGNRYWESFENEQIPSDVIKNRTEVISACIDLGINYLDVGTSAECLAYGAALRGRRDRIYIGVDDYKLSPRKFENCTVENLTFDINQCLRRLKTDYLDIWRVKADMYGRSTDAHVETIIKTFEIARKAGKVLHLGVSSHRRPWLQRVIEKYPQIEMVSFPYSATTKQKNQRLTNDNIKEVNAGYDADTEQSIFSAIQRLNIGLVTIKPFLGGHLFKSKPRFPVKGKGRYDSRIDKCSRSRKRRQSFL